MLVLVPFYVKMITYLVQYIVRIQVAANSYLCFPTAPRKKHGIEKQTDDMEGVKYFLLFNGSRRPNLLTPIEHRYLPLLCSQMM